MPPYKKYRHIWMREKIHIEKTRKQEQTCWDMQSIGLIDHADYTCGEIVPFRYRKDGQMSAPKCPEKLINYYIHNLLFGKASVWPRFQSNSRGMCRMTKMWIKTSKKEEGNTNSTWCTAGKSIV